MKTPSHGTARIRLWHLIDYAISTDKVRLVFGLFTEDHLIEAKVSMDFAQDCQVRLTHYGQEDAQVALHSYFHIGDIEQIEIQGLPTDCVSNLTKQHENVPSPAKFSKMWTVPITSQMRKRASLTPFYNARFLLNINRLAKSCYGIHGTKKPVA